MSYEDIKMKYKDEIITSTENLCKSLNKTRQTIHNWIKQGLPYHTVAYRKFYLKSEVASWLESREEKRLKNKIIKEDLLKEQLLKELTI